jgi:hypothetical protein
MEPKRFNEFQLMQTGLPGWQPCFVFRLTADNKTDGRAFVRALWPQLVRLFILRESVGPIFWIG